MSARMIAEFLAVRLDELEAAAKAAIADLAEDNLTWAGFTQSLYKASVLAADDDVFDYLDLCGPAFGLAIVAAGRAILAEFEATRPLAAVAMRRFAAIWADHPDCPR